MTEILELHRRALEHTRGYVAGIGADQWSLATPCADWDVRELLNHIVVGNLWAAYLADGRTIESVGDELDGDHLGEDPLARYDASASAARAAFGRPGGLEAPCAVSYGPVPGSVYAGHRFADVLIHGWDLATATGQDTTLPPDLVAECREILAPEIGALKGSGMFGGEVQPSSADPQAVLLAMLGRSV